MVKQNFLKNILIVRCLNIFWRGVKIFFEKSHFYCIFRPKFFKKSPFFQKNSQFIKNGREIPGNRESKSAGKFQRVISVINSTLYSFKLVKQGNISSQNQLFLFISIEKSFKHCSTFILSWTTLLTLSCVDRAASKKSS